MESKPEGSSSGEAPYSDETRRSAQALILLWPELPALVGTGWPEPLPTVEPLLCRISREAEPLARDWAVIELLEAFEPFPRVLARLAEVRKVFGLCSGVYSSAGGLAERTPLQ